MNTVATLKPHLNSNFITPLTKKELPSSILLFGNILVAK